jgi:small Trp-rich protein
MIMLFLGLGLVLLALKYFQIGAVAEWDWWWVLSPFGMAVVWWTLADYFGYSKIKAVKKEYARRQKRIEKHRAGLGMTRGRR